MSLPEEPLPVLAACNQRLLRHCADLRRLVLVLGERGFDAQARATAAGLFQFFDHELPRHHADEAQDLFPALLESMAGSDAACLHAITQGLGAQHLELQRLWRRLRPALDDAAAGRCAALPAREVETFVDHCRACVEREDGELLPMAARLLADAQLEQIATAMHARRAGPT
jgi:hemerythrin-like domain-containing protein